MIRKALGLGLLILILKFLMNGVYVAINDSLVSFLNASGVIFSKMGTVPTDAEIMQLVPR